MLDDLDDPEIPWPSQQEEMFLATWIRDIGYYRANNIVITSYSIHYTKLYDSVGRILYLIGGCYERLF